MVRFLFKTGVPHLCPFIPFQIIPYSHKEPETEFSFFWENSVLLKCYLRNVLAKFPDNATDIELPWLSKSYIKLTVLKRTLYFKVSEGFFSLFSFRFKFVVSFSLYSGEDQFQNCKAQ
jgi:hypothetical protein